MIDRLVAACLNRRAIAWAVFVLTALYGYVSWTRLPVEAYPDIADVTSQVITQVPGLAAEEVEQQITVPLERALIGTPGLHVMRSKSTFGLSMIVLVFKDGVEDYWSRQRIQERINDVALPYGAQPGLDPLTSPIGEIYRYTLESPTRSLRELSELQFWQVIPQFKRLSGVADVTNFGGITTQYVLYLDPSQLTRYNVSLKQITDAINANNASAGGSVIDRGQQGFVVRGIGLLRSLEDLGNVVVAQKAGTPIRVKDLGEVTLGNQERRGILGKDNHADGVSGIVLLLKGQNPSEVLEGVHQTVEKLNTKILPSDVKVVPYLDRTNLVAVTTHTVGTTLAEGMVLVTLVLVLFLGSPRAALIVALTIPMALLIAFILMHHLHIPANLLSLGAIDFGIIVDGSIVVVENILREREKSGGQALSIDDVLAATRQVARPIFFATIIIITAYIPLFAFERVEYKLFSPMAYAVGFSLFGALLVALALIPGLAFEAYRRPGRVFHNRVIESLTTRYTALLRGLLARHVIAPAVLAVSLCAVAVLGLHIGKDFLPELDEGSIWLQVTLPPGISLETAKGLANEVRKAAAEFPEVSHVVTQLGRNDEGTDPWTPSHIEASVGLHPYKTWKSGITKHELIGRMQERFSEIPGIVVGFSQPMIDGVNDKIAGAHSDLVIKVFGEDFGEARRISEKIMATIASVPGAADVAIDQEPPLPQVQITLDREAAARYGINAADVAGLIASGIGGQPISQLFVGEKRYDVVVRFTGAAREDPDAIGNLVLTAPTGARVPLSQVATVRLRSGESTITREMGRRHLTVKLNLRGRDLSAFLEDAKGRIESEVKYDPGAFEIVWGGQFENQQRAEARLTLHHADHPGDHVRAALQPVQESEKSDSHPGLGPPRDPGWPVGARPARNDTERFKRRWIHRAVRGCRPKRHHHGVQSESPRTRGREPPGGRGGRCHGTVPSGDHDGVGGDARPAARRTGDRLRKRRAAAARDRRRGRLDHCDRAHPAVVACALLPG